MSATGPAPVWAPDSHPVHRLLQLLDVLFEAYWRYAGAVENWLVARYDEYDDYSADRQHPLNPWFADVGDRVPTDHPDWWEFSKARRDAIRPWVALQVRVGSDEHARRRLGDYLVADAVAHLIQTELDRFKVEKPMRAAVQTVLLLLTPVRGWDSARQMALCEPGGAPAELAGRVAEVRGYLLLALAEAGQRVPAAIGCRRRLDTADLLTELPPPWQPEALAAARAGEVEPMSPAGLGTAGRPPDAEESDGPAADGRTVRWQGRPVMLTPVPFRVAAFMWDRRTAGFDELAAYVNENRGVGPPSNGTFRTWANRVNTDLRPLRLPWALSADTVGRVMSRDAVPVVPTTAPVSAAISPSKPGRDLAETGPGKDAPVTPTEGYMSG